MSISEALSFRRVRAAIRLNILAGGTYRSSNRTHAGTRDCRYWLWYLVFAVGFPLLIYLTIHNSLLRPVLIEVRVHHWARVILHPSILWTLMSTVLLGLRTILWFRYVPFPSANLESAPSLTVVIPAYNEGEMVLKAIESVATAQYPQDRLEIFVIDDGSTDNTWQFIRLAAARFPQLVKPIRMDKNHGKRTALAEGFRNVKTEVVVTLDSDSVLEPDSLLAITGPFCDPKVGAVAGKVAVYNRQQGLIPQMLHVHYLLSFDVQRAGESSFRTVYCCPGALSAYRTSVLREVLDRWIQQTFLASPCTFGEDRAMTNLILASGYDTVYQRSALVHTLVPVTYSKLCKMFIRWDRSYVREELGFMRILWRRPLHARLIALFDRFVQNAGYPVQYASLFLLAPVVIHRPWTLPHILLGIGLMSMLKMTYYLRTERPLSLWYGVFFSYFALVALFWVFPYAAVTVRARSWLTR